MTLVGAFVIVLVGTAAWAQPAELTTAWDAVKKARSEGLPKTAIETLAVIESKAVAREQWSDAVKAVKERIEIEIALRGGKPEEVMPLLRQAVSAMPERMRPLAEVVVAHLYWQYFSANRWRFSQRTGVAAGEEGQDIDAWGLPRILAEIEAQFGRVMAYEPVLMATPVEECGVLLQAGTAQHAYRPTLFDFAAYELIDFYALDEHAGTQAKDGLELAADGPALDDVNAFSFTIPEEAAQRSHVFRALRLFQKLLRFHEKDEDPTAYADADLQRLQFCRNHVVGESRDRRYASALDHFAQKWKRHEIISLAFALRARLALEAGQASLAWTLAQQGAAAYPKSVGAAQCRNVVSELETPLLTFSAEQVWCEPWPEMAITYKNLKAVQFRAVAVTFEELVKVLPKFAEPGSKAGAALLRRRPAKIWEEALPPAGDYKEHTFRKRVPDDLPPGLYAVFASPDGSFEKEGQPVAWGVFRVSTLTLVISRGEHSLGGTVLTAREGLPVAGAQVQVWRLNRKDAYTCEQPVATDMDGSFAIPCEQACDVLLCATKDGQAAQTWASVWQGSARERSVAANEHKRPTFSVELSQPAADARLGAVAWQASISCDAWQTVRKPVAISVRVETHSGVGAVAKGVLKLFSVKQPDRVRRPRQDGFAPYVDSSGGKDEDPANPETWPDDKELFSDTIQTGTNGVATVTKPLKAGLYRLRFEARDAAEKRVTARQLVRVVDPEATRLNIREPVYFEAESWSVEPGQTFRAVWGTGYDTAHALVVAEKNGRELKRWRTKAGETQQKIELPVTEAMRGGVVVRTLFVRENRLYAESRRIDVPVIE